MNLDNVDTLQNKKGLFTTVFTLSFLSIICLFLGIMSYLQKSGMMPTHTAKMHDPVGSGLAVGGGHLETSFMRFSTTTGPTL